MLLQRTRVALNHKPLWMPLPEYVKLHGRDAHLDAEELETMERLIRADWVHLEPRTNWTCALAGA